MADQERKASLAFGVDSAGVKPGLDDIKSQVRDMAADVQQSGQRAAKGITAIGDGAPAAAQKVDTGARSLIGSIQRTTAAMEAGEKGTAKYYETLAKQRGVSGDTLKPYLDDLRKAEAAQKLASGSLGSMEMSAKATSAALRGVPAQFTDIITSLQGGQAPLTVFLQQGGQLKDMFGGAGNAARALGGYVLGLVNPFTIAAAAGGVIALAYNQGSKEADGYRNALILTGNAAGTTSAQLKSYAQDISGIVGTQGKAAESLTALAASGKVSADVLRDAGLAAVQYERATGQAVGKTAEQFAALRNEPLSGVLKLNDGMNFLTESTYRQIKSLEEQGRTADAARVAQEAYADALTIRSKQIEQNLGYIEAGWKKIKDAAKGGWDAMLNVGRSSTPTDALGELRARLEAQQRELATKRAINPAADTSGMDKGIDILKQRIGLLESDERQMRRNAEAEAQTAANRQTFFEWDKQADAFRSKSDKRKEEVAKAEAEGRTLIAAGLIKEADLRERIAAINKKFEEKGSTAGQSEIAGIRAKIVAEQEYIDRLRERGVAADKVTEGERLTAKIQEELKGKLDAKTRTLKEQELVEAQRLATLNKVRASEEQRVKAIAESEAAYRKFLDSIVKAGDAVAEQAAKQEAANATFGKGKTAIEEMALAQQKLALANEKDSGPWDPARIAAMEVAITQQERYVRALQAGDIKVVNQHTDELLRNAQEQAKLYEDEARLIGLSAVERAKVVALRQVELKYAKELARIKEMPEGTAAQIAAKEEQRLKVLEAKQIESQAAVSKVIEDDWTKTSQLIGDTLADYIMGGGKDAAQYLKRLFATLVLQPTVQMGVNGLLGALGMGGSGGGGGTDFLGMISNLRTGYSELTGNGYVGNAYRAVSGWMGYGASAPGLGLTSSGTGLGLSSGGGYGITGSSYGANTIGAGIGNSTAAGGAGTGASMFSGGGGSLAGFGAFAAVAALALNALGAFRSERIAGNGLTGTLGAGKDLQPYSLWREGGTLFSGPRYSTTSPGEEIARYEQEIKDLRAQGKGGTETVAGLEEQLQYLKDTYGEQIAAAKKQSDAIQATYDAMRTSVGDMADVLGISSEAVRKFTMAVGSDLIHPDTGGYGLNFSGLSQEEIIAKVDEALRTANNTLAEQVIGTWKTITEEVRRTVVVSPTQWGDNYESAVYREDVETVTRQEYVQSEFARDGEKAIDTLKRLATSLTTVNSVFENLGQTLYASSLAGGDMASMLLDLFGGAENFGAATGTYFQNFYSEDEQRAAMQRQLEKQLGTLDLRLPDIDAADARAQYRRLAEAQDLTTDSGRKAYVMLMQLAGAFAGITAEAEEAKKAEEDRIRAAEQARKQLIDSTYSLFQRALSRDRDALSEQASAISDVISTISSSVDMLTSNARELYGTVDSTAQMLAAQGMVYIEQALAGVRGGASLTGYDGLTDAISAARGGISGGNYATEFDRQRDTLVLAGQLSELGELGDLQLSFEERQLKAVNAQLEALDALGKRADALVNGTQELTDTVDGYFAKLIAILAPEKTPGTGGASGSAAGGGFVIGGTTGRDTPGSAAQTRPGDRDKNGNYIREQYLGGYGSNWQTVSNEEQARLDALNRDIVTDYSGSGDVAGVMAEARANGYSLSDLATVYGVSYADALRKAQELGIPAFAGGGLHSGGLRVVGERGWEIEATGPARIWNQQQLAQAMGGGGGIAELAAVVAQLTEQNALLAEKLDAIERNTAGMPQMAREINGVTVGGTVMRTRVAQGIPA